MGDFPLTALDVAVIVVVGLSALVALARGAVREVFTFVAWIGAFVVAWYAYTPLRPVIRDAVGNDVLADLATGAAVFLVPLIVFKIIGASIASAVAGSSLGLMDRLLGLAFGVARGALLVVVAYLLGSMIVPPDKHPTWVTQAQVLPTIRQGTAWLKEQLPADLEAKAQAAVTALPGGPGRAGQPSAREIEKGYTPEQRRELERVLPTQ